MASSTPTIFVLDKQNYSKHRLVNLPDDSKPTLAPSSLRFRSKVLGLTTNNLTYARLGAFMGWYDIFPLPPNTPEPYRDTATYGRTSAWGYAEIVESTVDGISVGQTIFGYLPISTDTETLRCEYAEHNGEKIPDQIVILDEHRQHLWKVYNRYQICPPIAELEKTVGWDSIGFDALMQVLYGTSYWLNRHGLAWTDEDRIHPTGEGDWTAEDTDLRGATVVILNASGKTGMSFAYALRENRPAEHQPKTIIGVGSQNSVGTIVKSGLYDQAELNSDAQRIASEIEKCGSKRVVLVDFGARVGANKDWRAALEATSVPFTLLTVGGEVEVQNHEKAMARLGEMASLCIINASKLREKSIEVGGDRYIKEFLQAWEEFKGKQKMMTLQWGEGMEEFEKGWDEFCEDKVPASVGKVYRL